MKKPDPTKEKVSKVEEERPYMILHDKSEVDLERKVCKHLELGWILIGPAYPMVFSQGEICFYQTVVRANVPVK